MAWDLSDNRPIFKQLTEHITLDILSGGYKAGNRIPAVRELALDAGVNPNTMQRALSTLEEAGIIFTVRGDGRYVTEDKSVLREARKAYVSEKTDALIDSLAALSFTADEMREAFEKALLKNKSEEE